MPYNILLGIITWHTRFYYAITYDIHYFITQSHMTYNMLLRNHIWHTRLYVTIVTTYKKHACSFASSNSCIWMTIYFSPICRFYVLFVTCLLHNCHKLYCLMTIKFWIWFWIELYCTWKGRFLWCFLALSVCLYYRL
jgi:hypothetical protein